MFSRRHILLGSAGLACGPALGAPESEVIRGALKEVVGTHGDSVGIVAAAIDAKGVQMASYGSSGIPGLALDGDTVFPVMSITKVMTSLLLADMARRGEVAFGDPVAKYLPEKAAPPINGRPVTLLDLATYRSGLAFMPGNLPTDWYQKSSPLADYSEDQLFAFLSSTVPAYAPGTHYEYANLAFGVLGIALARAAGKSFDQLLVERVCRPLGLSDTRSTLTAAMRQHLAQGHDIKLKPYGLWDAPVMPGIANLRSTAADLSLFLKACLGLLPSPLEKPLARLLQNRAPTPLVGTEAAMGWFISRDGDAEIAWKSGLSNGYNSFIGYSSALGRGAVVLTNFIWLPIDTGTIMIGMKMIKPDFQTTDFFPLYKR